MALRAISALDDFCFRHAAPVRAGRMGGPCISMLRKSPLTDMLRLMEDRFEKLTDAQCECLRLIYMRWQLREIAGKLNISVGAVNQRLRSARQTLGVQSSIEAARLLADHEHLSADYISPPSSRNTVSAAPLPDADEIAFEEREPQADWPSVQEVREVQAAYRAASIDAPWLRWPVPLGKGQSNDLTFGQILFWVVAIALGVGMAAFTVVALALSIHEVISRF